MSSKSGSPQAWEWEWEWNLWWWFDIKCGMIVSAPVGNKYKTGKLKIENKVLALRIAISRQPGSKQVYPVPADFSPEFIQFIRAVFFGKNMPAALSHRKAKTSESEHQTLAASQFRGCPVPSPLDLVNLSVDPVHVLHLRDLQISLRGYRPGRGSMFFLLFFDEFDRGAARHGIVDAKGRKQVEGGTTFAETGKSMKRSELGAENNPNGAHFWPNVATKAPAMKTARTESPSSNEIRRNFHNDNNPFGQLAWSHFQSTDLFEVRATPMSDHELTTNIVWEAGEVGHVEDLGNVNQLSLHFLKKVGSASALRNRRAKSFADKTPN
ncbi:hypothetical protein B0H13DRAFT_1851455 [Mycena leptocephala]|nr:hypothetical protein B0H13DRAFT_1851455 [Mycena leptocephala]